MKLISLVSVVLLLVLVSNSSATNCWWQGNIDDDIFNQANYDRPLNPGEPDSTTGVNWSDSGNPLASANLFKVQTGQTVDLATMWTYDEHATTANPYTSKMVINGTLTLHQSYQCIGTATDYDSILEMNSGTLNADESVLVGRLLVLSDPYPAGTGYLNMTGGTIYTNLLAVGTWSGWYDGRGVVNLDGGTINAGDLAMEPTCLIDITDGKLVINGDMTTQINDYISNGWIKADGGAGTLSVEFEDGYTTVVRLDTRIASDPYPDDEDDQVPHEGVVLTWAPGIYANKHTVYFGTSLDDVNESATPVSPEQDANDYGPLDLYVGQQYFWRIDEVNTTEPNTWTGKIWSFKTAGYLVVDDMESYDDDWNLILFTWMDGTMGDTSGSMIYLQQGPPVNGGNQSMRYIYKNDGSTGTPYYSEIRRSFSPAEDWTASGRIKGLVLFFKGDPGNDPEQMYVALSDGTTTAVSVHPNPNAAGLDDWQQWAMGFDDFAGVNPEHIETLYIGFGDRDSHPDPGGTGTVYFDDIRRYPAICLYKPGCDYNNDCVVDFKDLAIFSAAWIGTDRNLWP